MTSDERNRVAGVPAPPGRILPMPLWYVWMTCWLAGAALLRLWWVWLLVLLIAIH